VARDVAGPALPLELVRDAECVGAVIRLSDEAVPNPLAARKRLRVLPNDESGGSTRIESNDHSVRAGRLR
jgi:hypothetical protein